MSACRNHASAWIFHADSGWRHAPRWKVAINTALRRLQRGRPRVWLVYSNTTTDGDPPEVLSYGFGRIAMRYPMPFVPVFPMELIP